ncbi:MAG TPA: GNAT family N-acetyltransferase [Albitalea sp.]|uniref:GNAT family N-acetyltransferase n=1 Tax=Piscinibacter sp. TaxID=1903157 RepID=UPI002ED2C81A
MRALVAGDLRLEPQTADHADEMFVVLSDPAIYTYENAPPASVDALRERYRRLESRRSADGREHWLNWVIRLASGELAGYVQATVMADGRAFIAYELASAHWGQGIARRAVQPVIDELVSHYGVTGLAAVAKRSNARSIGLLRRLGFTEAAPGSRARETVEADEVVFERPIG